MSRRERGILARVLAAGLLLAGSAVVLGAPRNVILMIGDGMDEQQIAIARYYLHGPDGRFAMEQMPRLASVIVQTVAEAAPHRPDFIADSANAATTLATGQLTSQGRISTAPGDDRALPTLFEQAQAAGYRTGIVTTSSVTDATPAAFVTHINSRACEGPELMDPSRDGPGCARYRTESGGAGSIAEQLAASRLDLLLGGGARYFAQRVPGARSVSAAAHANGFRVLIDPRKLSGIEPGTRVLGLLSRTDLPRGWIGESARVAEPITRDADGKPVFPAPFACVPGGRPRIATLAAMTTEALRLLSGGNRRGLLLVVEGASIDKAAHERDPCGQIGELQGFDRAVTVAREFVARNRGTLLIVTADHAQAGQVVGTPALYREYMEYSGQAEYNPGYYAVLRTPRGDEFGVSYATNVAGTESELHTGANVPAFLEGPGIDEVPAVIAQRELHTLMQRHLRLAR